MPIVTVIIPFYQHQHGILTRALRSILSQRLPDGWSIEVIIVDDGSPSRAQDEVDTLSFTGPINSRIVRQNNGGVASARNKGLDETKPSSTLIAFLDSDDIWSPDHLSHAIEAHTKGFDFYFTDNRRPGFHDSHVYSNFLPETKKYITTANREIGLVEIPIDYMVELILREFPTQASTVVYGRSIAPNLRFNTKLKSAAEDVLFFTSLAAFSHRVAFDAENCVECGGGMNMFFGNLDWDSPKILAIKLDQLLAHYLIRETITLSADNRVWNERHVIDCRRDFVFHVIRNLVKHPSRVPRELWRFISQRPLQTLSIPGDVIYAAMNAMVGRQHGSDQKRPM